jgi:hypothetical protein
MASAEPSRLVKRRCWKMLLSASGEGDHEARCFCRQRSLSEALMLTTTERRSGCSGSVTLNLRCAA